MSVNIMTLDAVLKNFGDRLTIIEERHMSGVFAGNPTLRDQFAMAALPEMMRQYPYCTVADEDQDSVRHLVAAGCYVIADAMVAEGAKK